MPVGTTAPPIRFGVVTEQAPPWAGVVGQWQEIEALGFDSAWLTDHFMTHDDEDSDLYVTDFRMQRPFA